MSKVDRNRRGRRKTGGRKKGTPNRATATAREAIARLVDGNAQRLEGWLNQIATDEGPRAAWDCFVKLLEFHVPKLARSELTGRDGVPLNFVVTVPPKADGSVGTGQQDAKC